ncbi:hypothetical protein SLNSH_07820 [Alsobacter soli]|uniref:Pycsar effector protein domain-containing protein n=1 Tax=Alsobacter soli TaxID=2109933 RepID=A0A2T1HV63_9HYPH|nr:Pycsar system effector family protein [Alsobacter soli]PSC05490.1 hypothetical protein SLNSH_07820 [Alsobacter soli]
MTKQHIERAEKALQRMLDWIARHDSRSSAVLGITIAMVGALSASIPSPSQWTWTYALALAAAVIGLGAVLTELLRGQFPRMRSTPSLFFFGTVANLPLDQYRSEVAALDDEAYLKDLLTQCHTNARILRSKFRSLKRSIFALLCAAVPWAVALGLGKGL